MKELKYIDFYEKIKSLHNEMLSEIQKMLVLADIKEIVFGDENFSHIQVPEPYIVVSPDGSTSTYESSVQKLSYRNGVLEAFIPDYDKPIGLSVSDMVLMCTIDSLYDAVYQYTSKKLERDNRESLNQVEQAVYDLCKQNADYYGEDGGFCYEETEYESLGLTTNQMKGYLSILQQKGYIAKVEESYFSHVIK